MGSTDNVNLLRLPTARLDGLLLTHFHSDHIAEIYEVNLGSWVNGRPAPLTVFGPRGVDEVVEGINVSYRQDRIYRVGHHGEALLPPALGVLAHKTIEPGVILDDGQLKITAYVGEHPPIEPAVGYRFDYRGRSVVISGDSNVSDSTRQITEGADLLLPRRSVASHPHRAFGSARCRGSNATCKNCHRRDRLPRIHRVIG